MTDLQEQLAFIRDHECSADAEKDAVNRAIDYISNSAPVVHGRWTWTGSVVEWKCSVCEGEGYENFKFCPHCGAKMDEESEGSGNV